MYLCIYKYVFPGLCINVHRITHPFMCMYNKFVDAVYALIYKHVNLTKIKK